MKNTLATLFAAAAILTAAPAFAQMSSGKMSGDMPMTCQGMMDKQMPMMNSMSDGNKKMMAMKEMDMAKKAMSSGNEKTCMMHMKKSMGMM